MNRLTNAALAGASDVPEWSTMLQDSAALLAGMDLTVDAEATEPELEIFERVREILRLQVGALDAVARAIGREVLQRTAKRLPYHPKVTDADRFAGSLQSQLPGIARSHPDIAHVYEIHQPYQRGHAELAFLYSLSGVRRATALPITVLDGTLTIEHAGQQMPLEGTLRRNQQLVSIIVDELVSASGVTGRDSGASVSELHQSSRAPSGYWLPIAN